VSLRIDDPSVLAEDFDEPLVEGRVLALELKGESAAREWWERKTFIWSRPTRPELDGQSSRLLLI
jgi:hypothetical protein